MFLIAAPYVADGIKCILICVLELCHTHRRWQLPSNLFLARGRLQNKQPCSEYDLFVCVHVRVRVLDVLLQVMAVTVVLAVLTVQPTGTSWPLRLPCMCACCLGPRATRLGTNTPCRR